MRKRLASMCALMMIATCCLSAVGTNPSGDRLRGTPETCISRVSPAMDGTRADTGANAPNGISYFWEQAEAFNSSATVATFGTNTKGIAVDAVGTWTYNSLYTQCSGDAGSWWDAWSTGEQAVQVYEVFNDQSVSGRNYTCIFEELAMDGDGSTSFGTYNAQNAMTPINDPTLAWMSEVNNTCAITIAPQTTGFEVAALFDGYGVWKSIAGPITQTNQGTHAGDAALENGVWVFRDTGWNCTSHYSVRVKWDGGTYPFFEPFYSYGMSNDVEAPCLPSEPPESSVNAVSPYWRNASPLAAGANATAYSGATVANVTLFYRFSANNVSWGSWTSYGTDGTAPWSWSFAWPAGQGYYQFYSVAADSNGLVENATGAADAAEGYDTTAPTHMVGLPFAKQSNLNPCTIPSNIGDSLSGMGRQDMYYSLSPSGPWTLFGTSYMGSWSFTWPYGDGTYYFIFDGWDRAGNHEGWPVDADDWWIYDGTPPTSTVDVITPYWSNSSPFTITATAVDTWYVQLWHRYSADNATWGSWSMYANDTASPFSWSYTCPSGQGFYQFYSLACDSFGNLEAAPASADAMCGYDSAAPTSSVNTISPYEVTLSPLTIAAAAADSTSGAASVELWYRYALDNMTWGAWTKSGTDTASPWSWSFNFPNGSGYYQFYSRATDRAGNYESAPATADTRCRGPMSSTYATAIGPTGSGGSSVTITYTWVLSPIAVHLYYTTNGGTTWTLAGNDTTVDGAYAWTCPVSATYGWIAVAVGGGSFELNPPPGGTTPEASAYIFAMPPPRASDLWVELANPNVVLHWSNATDPTTGWNVYRSTSKWAAFPGGWMLSTAAASARTWTHSGAYADGNTWYYIVRADNGGTLSGNSTMGVKLHQAFTHNAINTNVQWMSLPYNSMYKTARDVVVDLEGGDGVTSGSMKISVVGLWQPGYQAATAYCHVAEWGEWTGDNFAIPPGAGIYVSVVSSFNWIINGTDYAAQLSFVKNAANTNVMFFSLPYGSDYRYASDIVMELEGALFGPGLDSKICVVGLWDFPSQMANALVYDTDFEEWTGMNFEITPGCGLYIAITSSFAWTPGLLTPEVP
jgi:hypothetical protein